MQLNERNQKTGGLHRSHLALLLIELDSINWSLITGELILNFAYLKI